MEKILQLKADIFDLIRERDILTIRIDNINKIIQQKLEELEKLEQEEKDGK